MQTSVHTHIPVVMWLWNFPRCGWRDRSVEVCKTVFYL